MKIKYFAEAWCFFRAKKKGGTTFLSPSLGCQMYKQFTGKDINDMQPFIVMSTADGTLVLNDTHHFWRVVQRYIGR